MQIRSTTSGDRDCRTVGRISRSAGRLAAGSTHALDLAVACARGDLWSAGGAEPHRLRALKEIDPAPARSRRCIRCKDAPRRRHCHPPDIGAEAPRAAIAPHLETGRWPRSRPRVRLCRARLHRLRTFDTYKPDPKASS